MDSNKTKKLYLGLFLFAAALVFFHYNNTKHDAEKLIHTIIESPDGSRLSINMPSCISPSIEKKFLASRGTWVIDHNAAKYLCKSKSIDLLQISGIGKHARSEYLLKDPKVRLIRKEGIFETYRFGWKGEDAFEVVSFIADDGYRVYLRYMIDDPSTQLIYRRLNDSFEITYGLHRQINDHTAMLENDKKILTHIKSITEKAK